jgi:hypothetical protein
MITLFHAIQSLVPGAEVSVGIHDQAITWHKPDTAPVTLEQIQQEQRCLQLAYDWSEYQRNRAREYPTVEEQLDALYHAGVFPPEMAERIRAVKAKYPRPQINQQQWIQQMPASTAATTPEPKMTVETWLSQEAKITRDQWLEQQKNQAQPRQMTREEWLAEQLNLRN